MNILEKISSQIETITEADISSWAIEGIVEHYASKINYWAYKSNSNSHGPQEVSALAIRAFKEEMRIKLARSLQLFIIERKYWKIQGYVLNTYLLSTIKNFAKSKYWVIKGISRVAALICPACKIQNEKNYLVSEKNLWRCHSCTDRKNEIEESLIDYGIDENDIIKLQDKHRLYSTFALHSRKGYKCPECGNFIPASSVGEFGVVCPYEKCGFSGDVTDLEIKSHPSSSTNKSALSLNAPCPTCTNLSYQDTMMSGDSKPDTDMNFELQYGHEREVLLDVISKQIDLINRTGIEHTKIKKLLMYQAYRNMIDVCPEEMHSYLVLLQQARDFPIQSRIFQEYIRLVENYLPITICRNGEQQDILSLTDPRLALFTGKSVFKANIDANYIIPNNTEETYIGGRKFTNYGPCFIGRLIDVIDDRTNESILDFVKEYNFVQITMKNNIETNIPVTVSHFRIPSHYELGSLVYLQRIRRQIVDSVYFRLNNKKRPLKSEIKELAT